MLPNSFDPVGLGGLGALVLFINEVILMEYQPGWENRRKEGN